MKLLNFRLKEPSVTTAINSLGYEWDLHSFANFEGFRFFPEKDEIELVWTAPNTSSNPWGDENNTFKSCRMVFKKIFYLKLE